MIKWQQQKGREEKMEIVYQIDSFGMTPEKVALRFTREYFEEPRDIEYFTNDAVFGLVDGNRKYQVKFKQGDYIKTSDTFEIITL